MSTDVLALVDDVGRLPTLASDNADGRKRLRAKGPVQVSGSLPEAKTDTLHLFV